MGFCKKEDFLRGQVKGNHYHALCAHDEDMCVIANWLPKGTVKDFQHHKPTQVYIMIEGTMEVTIGDETQIITAGDTAIVPSDYPHKVVALEDVLEMEVFNDPRNDVIDKWFKPLMEKKEEA